MKVLICDDSAIARKLLVRAIVSDTSTHLIEARDGYEALQIMCEQKIDVLFLDLTMPVMDGFEVLAALPVNNHSTTVVVVSGDIQQESQRRCFELGAFAFMKKPFDHQQASGIFAQLGLQYFNTIDHGNYVPQQQSKIQEEQKKLTPLDKFREVANIALGNGAAIMGNHLNEFIQLPLPHVEQLSAGELQMTMIDVVTRKCSMAVAQRFVGGGIHGEALVCLRGQDIHAMGDLLGYYYKITTYNEVFLNISYLMVSSFLISLGNQLDKQFSLRQPAIISSLTNFNTHDDDLNEICAIEYTYTAENIDFECEVLFLIDKQSVDIIYEIMELI